MGSGHRPRHPHAPEQPRLVEGYIPRCLTVYGDPADRRFAGVWVKNTDAVLWSWWFAGPDLHRRLSDALASGGMRPAAFSVATDGAILSMFRDRVGDWHERHGLTAAEYQAEFDRRSAAGWPPACWGLADGSFADSGGWPLAGSTGKCRPWAQTVDSPRRASTTAIAWRWSAGLLSKSKAMETWPVTAGMTS